MKKNNLIIVICILLYIFSTYRQSDEFNNLNIKFEKSIFQIHAHNIKFNWIEPYKNVKSDESIGTGFLIDKNGYILTCSHVISNSIKVFVSLPAIGKKTFEVDIVNFCPSVDIALLKIRDINKFKKVLKDNLEPIKLGNSDKIKPGEKSLALGYPLGEDKLKRTSGIISGIQSGHIQTDTPINPGNSGGPLINTKGEVVGINFALNARGINVGYAVPINKYYLIEKVLNTPLKNGIIHTPTVGMQVNNTNKDMIEFISKNRINNNNGYYISNVFKNGSFYQAGIKNGDILISFNNNILDNFGESKVKWSYEKVNLIEIIHRSRINDIIPIEYFSTELQKIIKTNIKLKDSTFYKIRYYYPPFEKVNYIVYCGIILMNLTNNHLKILPNLDSYKENENKINSELVLTKVLPGSFIKRNRIFKKGDIIKKINNINVNDVKSAIQAFKKPLVSQGNKYIKIENSNKKVFILTLKNIMKEEQFLSHSHNYKISIN